MISTEKNQANSKQSNQIWVKKAQSQLGLDSCYAKPNESVTTATVRRMLSLLRHPMLNVYHYEGYSTVLDNRMSILIADDGRETPYILKITGMSNAGRIYKGKVSALNAYSLSGKHDINFVVSNRLLCRRLEDAGYYVLPAWVRLFVHLWDDPENMLKTLGTWAKRDVRHIRSNSLTYEVTNDPFWVDEFYDNMYVPLINVRHGDVAVIRSRERIHHYFKQGCIMLIKKDDRVLGGCLLVPVGDVLMWPLMGMVGGSFEAMREGGASALYWFVMKWAYENGYKSVNFGHCRPFLTDGVLRYKLKWGMRVLDDDDAVRDISIKVNPDSVPGMQFLSQNPFLHLSDGLLTVHSLSSEQSE